MKGSVIINGTDIGDLGMFILKGGDHDFLPFPERITPKSNNWFEQNGMDIDLSEAFFKARNLSVQFYLKWDEARDYEFYLNEFYRLISNGYINLYSREFERAFNLRYLKVSDYRHTGGMYKERAKRGKIKVDFSMDDPLQLFTNPLILEPQGNYSRNSHISLNGIDLGAFGIIVNECYNSRLKLSAVKAPITRSFERRSGLLAYPNDSPTFEAKEIVVKCTMRANNRTEFYHNYEALFNQVSKNEGLSIESYLGQDSCYYNKMTDFKKLGNFSRGVKVRFTLHFMQIDTGLTVFILGAEDGSALLTEDGKFIEITR